MYKQEALTAMTQKEAIKELFAAFVEHGCNLPHHRAKAAVMKCAREGPQSVRLNNGTTVTVDGTKQGGYEIWWTTGGIWPHMEESNHRTKTLLLL